MTPVLSDHAVRLWTAISDSLDIPRSLYERAADRHKAVAEWLCRQGSVFGGLNPSVHPQGSFRFGTVVRPIVEGAEYDVDHVITVGGLDESKVTQEHLKQLAGAELAGYATAHGMLAPEEKNRCWRLQYRDENMPFHLDSLPCVPAGIVNAGRLLIAQVSPNLAGMAVSVTDRRHPRFTELSADWLKSNPRGFAEWFEQRAALGLTGVAKEGTRAEVQPVAPYKWRTPLQRVIQILKRHRDVMFRDDATFAPISMIITNLAAHAYRGEADVATALVGVVTRMRSFVRSDVPRVPNPADPREDYADRWTRDPRYELNFNNWHTQLLADVQAISTSQVVETTRIKQRFGVPLNEVQVREIGGGTASLAGATVPSVRVSSGPQPWSSALLK